jgi:WD40 repeat protein
MARGSRRRAERATSSFDGFISYSHAVDGELAPKLQHALSRFAKPWYDLRSLRMFRDEANLSADPALWSTIQTALSESRWFILLASPLASQSKWVSKEVQYWLEHKSAGHLLIALTEGEIVWRDRLRCFDPAETTALPAALMRTLPEEPRWIDLRWVRTGKQLTLRDPRFRNAVADLAAPLHGRDKDELIGEDIRQHRRAKGLAIGAAVLLAMLTIATSVTGLVAIQASKTARTQRDRAIAQARLATSRQVASQSEIARQDNQTDLALLLAAQASRLQATPEASGALLGALNDVPRLDRIVYTPSSTLEAISADGGVIAMVEADHRVHLRGLVGGSTASVIPVTGTTGGVGISPDGSVVTVGDQRGTVTIDDVTGHRPPRRFPGPKTLPGEEGPFQGTSFALTAHGKLVAWNGAEISLWDGHRVHKLSPGITPGSWLLAFGDDGRELAAASATQGTVVVWRLNGSRPLGRPISFHAGSGQSLFGQGIGSISFSPTNPNLLAVGGLDGTVALWNPRLARRLWLGRGTSGVVRALAYSSDGRLLVSGGARAAVWGIQQQRRLILLPPYSTAQAVGFLTGSSRVETGAPGRVATWDPFGSPSQLAQRLYGQSRIEDAAYSAASDILATLDNAGNVRVWNSATLRPIGTPITVGSAIGLAVSGDGHTIATWNSAPSNLTITNVGNGDRQVITTLPQVRAATFNPAGAVLVATYSSGRAEVWQVSPRKLLWRLQSSAQAGAIQLASNGTAAATTGSGSEITLWRPGTGAVIRHVAGATGVLGFELSEDGHVLATSDWNNSTITLWNTQDGKPIADLTDAAAPSALASNGKMLAALTRPGTIRIWQLPSGTPLSSQGLVAAVTDVFPDAPALAFAPDGHRLTVIGQGSTALVYDVDESSWPTIACRLASRSLTRAEWTRYIGPGFDYVPSC